MMCAARNSEVDNCPVTFEEMEALVARAVREGREKIANKLRFLYQPQPTVVPPHWSGWENPSDRSERPQVTGRCLSQLASRWLLELRSQS